MQAIRDDMHFLGTVGEDDNKVMVYLIGTSRKMDKPLAGIILSQSGAGSQASCRWCACSCRRRTWRLSAACHRRPRATWGGMG